jgi:hypothetical protein
MEDKTTDVQIRLYAFWLDDVSYSTRTDFDPDNPDTRFYSNGVWAGGITKDRTFCNNLTIHVILASLIIGLLSCAMIIIKIYVIKKLLI